MDEYQHSLFFEAKDLTEREVEKIRRHFQRRRDSGGGDCGIIEKAGGNIYKISFKEKEDQERVLQRKFHTISLPSGQLRVTVRRTSSAQKPDQPSGIQSQTLTKANTKGIEKIFKLDIFLLLYLRNNPKANKVLENQLSSIGCTVEFNLVEEKIIVRGDADKGTRGAFASAAEHWEIQVDRVFIRVTESYLCHHVVEPKQVEILLQDLSFVNDGINVYTEGSYAVLVGENEAVKERIAILEKSLPTQRELPVVEKQLKLVEEEFSREMLNSFPEVKIHRSNARIILEGPGREVQSGAAKLDELLKKVKEKRVTLCAALLTFITSSGAISKYEAHFQRNLRNPVLLEVESDLVLSSLSPGALDKAEAALQRDLSLADVPLQGAAALPADLDRVKKVMIQAKNEANSQELRVDVSFIPGPGGAVTKVRLVGFSEHVNKLREVLHDYQMNQVGTQEVLSLPHPELVDCFDKLLNIIGVKQTNVTFKPSHFPYPCVSVSGPRCLVQEAYANLNATLGSLTSDTLTLDGSGAQRYFQAEGKVSKELIETSFQVLIREQQGAYSVTSLLSISSPNTSGTPRPSITRGHCSAGGSNAASKTSLNLKLGSLGDEQYYHDVCRPLSLNMDQEGQAIFRSLPTDLDEITMTVGGGVKLQLVYGDITHETTDAVVNTTDFVNFQIDGVCKDILAIAGPGVEAELKAVKVNRGGVFVSRPGLFPCKAILHVHGEKDASIIERLVCSIVERCETLGFKSVAIPAISTGTGGMDPGVVAGAILRGVKAATSSTPLYSLTDIHLVLNRISIFLLFKEKAMRMFSTAVIERVSAPQLPHVHQPPSSVSADLSILRTTSTSQQSVFLFLGISRQDIEDAMKKLEDLYQAQCSTYTFKKEELAGFTAADMEDLKQLVETEGLYMQCNQSGQGRLTVRGLKDGVNQVMKMINASLHNSLRREVRVRKEEDLYARVAWCIQGHNGKWERLPKTANHKLENKDIAGGIVDAQGISWIVDLHRLEAKRPDAAQTVKLKRLVNLPDFTLPLYWDNMAAGENLKAFVLQPSSAEYQTVKEAFKQTVSKTVVKIERLQNVHLRRAYEVQKRHISEKNRQEGGAVEKLLYHGTTQDNCDSIMKTGFNRSFATAYGHGTYFAVDACYSAQPTFSKRAADGSQLMFVARVLTGYYTLGQRDMRVPPPRRGLQPHDRFDSVVDNIHNPNMYVVFHDSQAYPDYLITFK